MAEQDDQLGKVAEKRGIGGIHRHVFYCTGGKCSLPEEGEAGWEALKGEIKEKGLSSGPLACYRTKVGCLRLCQDGPIALVYPEGTWYHDLTADRIPEFVQQHLVEGKPLQDLVFAKNPLG